MTRTILFTLLGILVTWVVMSRLHCNQRPLPPQEATIKLAIDSMVIAEQIRKEYYDVRGAHDSVVIVQMRRNNDSLRGIVVMWRERSQGRAIIIKNLIAQRDSLTTPAEKEANYQELKKQVQDGMELVEIWQGNAEMLDSNYRSLVDTLQKSIHLKDSLFRDEHNSFMDYKKTSDALVEYYKNLLTRSKKKTFIAGLIAAILAGLLILKK